MTSPGCRALPRLDARGVATCVTPWIMPTARAGTRPARGTAGSRACRHSDPCRWSRRALDSYIVADERRARHADLRDIRARLRRSQHTRAGVAAIVNIDAV